MLTIDQHKLAEIIAFLRETFNILRVKSPDSFPCQTLIDNFNNNNGYQLLSPWFDEIEEKEYPNHLQFKFSDFEDLEKYFRFKQAYYIPDDLDNKNVIFNKMISRLREHLQSGHPFIITKDDTIFICKKPFLYCSLQIKKNEIIRNISIVIFQFGILLISCSGSIKSNTNSEINGQQAKQFPYILKLNQFVRTGEFFIKLNINSY